MTGKDFDIFLQHFRTKAASNSDWMLYHCLMHETHGCCREIVCESILRNVHRIYDDRDRGAMNGFSLVYSSVISDGISESELFRTMITEYEILTNI